MAIAQQLADYLKTDFLKVALKTGKRVNKMSRVEAADTLKMTMTTFARTMIGNSETDARSTFIAREQLQPSEAYDILYDNFFNPFHHFISSLTGRLIGLNGNDPQAIIIAHAIIGQSLAFLVAKETYLRRQGIEDLDEARVDHIARVLGDLAVHACSFMDAT